MFYLLVSAYSCYCDCIVFITYLHYPKIAKCTCRETTFMSQMENALVHGLPIVLINVQGDELSPALLPLLRFCSQQGNSDCCLVKFGSRRVQLHSGFRLYFVTSEPEHNLSADIASHLSVIDYSPTFDLVTETMLDKLCIQVCM